MMEMYVVYEDFDHYGANIYKIELISKFIADFAK